MEGVKTAFTNFDMLTQLSDEELIVLYRKGQDDASEVLIERYKPYVRKRIRSNFFVGADKDDLIQEAMIGLLKAIADYRLDKEASFKSFATICITRQVSTAFKTATRQKHMPLNTSISLNLPVATEEDDNITLMDTIKTTEEFNPEELVIHQENLEDFKKYMREALSSLEWKVLQLHTEGKNYQEIAILLGKTNKCIDNALQRIKRKLAHGYR